MKYNNDLRSIWNLVESRYCTIADAVAKRNSIFSYVVWFLVRYSILIIVLMILIGIAIRIPVLVSLCFIILVWKSLPKPGESDLQNPSDENTANDYWRPKTPAGNAKEETSPPPRPDYSYTDRNSSRTEPNRPKPAASQQGSTTEQKKDGSQVSEKREPASFITDPEGNTYDLRKPWSDDHGGVKPNKANEPSAPADSANTSKPTPQNNTFLKRNVESKNTNDSTASEQQISGVIPESANDPVVPKKKFAPRIKPDDAKNPSIKADAKHLPAFKQTETSKSVKKKVIKTPNRHQEQKKRKSYSHETDGTKKVFPQINPWVEVGDRVTYVEVRTRKQEKVIISHRSSLPERGLINSETAVASALLGKIKGQIVEVRLKPRGYVVEVIEVEKNVEKDSSFIKSQDDILSFNRDIDSSKIYEGEAQGELWRDVAREGNRFNSGSLYDNYGDESEP